MDAETAVNRARRGPRIEDDYLVRGAGRFIADAPEDGQVYAAFVRSHFDAMAVRVPDAPRSDEILVAIVVTSSGRPHPRIGGLKKEEAKKEDGLR